MSVMEHMLKIDAKSIVSENQLVGNIMLIIISIAQWPVIDSSFITVYCVNNHIILRRACVSKHNGVYFTPILYTLITHTFTIYGHKTNKDI